MHLAFTLEAVNSVAILGFKSNVSVQKFSLKSPIERAHCAKVNAGCQVRTFLKF